MTHLNNVVLGKHFDPAEFEIVQTNAGKRITIKKDVEYFTLNLNASNAQHSGTSGNEARRRLYLVRNFGYLHLDFTFRGRTNAHSVTLFNFQNGQPRPLGLLELQTFDGGNIWIEDNGAEVKCSGLVSGQRYIVNIVGFWRR